MSRRTEDIEKLLDEGVSMWRIARDLGLTEQWVVFVRNRYFARKYKSLYEHLVEQLKGEEEQRQ